MGTKRQSVDVSALVKGEGTLTKAEADALGGQYRTADRAEALAALHKGRIAYIVKERGVADADGQPVPLAALAEMWGVSGAAITQGHSQYATLVLAGLSGEPDAVQRDAFRTATALRKISAGKDEGAAKAYRARFAEVVSDVAALPAKERVQALADAVKPLRDEAAALRKGAAPSEPSARETPETDGSKAADGKADLIAHLTAALALAAEGIALTNTQTLQVERYLGLLASGLGLNIEGIRENKDAADAEAAALV